MVSFRSAASGPLLAPPRIAGKLKGAGFALMSDISAELTALADLKHVQKAEIDSGSSGDLVPCMN